MHLREEGERRVTRGEEEGEERRRERRGGGRGKREGMEGCASLKVWVCVLKISSSRRIVVLPLVQTHPAKVVLALCEGGGCVQREEGVR